MRQCKRMLRMRSRRFLLSPSVFSHRSTLCPAHPSVLHPPLLTPDLVIDVRVLAALAAAQRVARPHAAAAHRRVRGGAARTAPGNGQALLPAQGVALPEGRRRSGHGGAEVVIQM